MNDIMHRDLRPECGASFPPDVTALILKLWEKVLVIFIPVFFFFFL